MAKTYQEISDLISEKLASNSNITAAEHREVEVALLDFAESQWLTGDIKEIDCTDAYIAANFTNNGFGINERAGWAICNGLNGTRNRTGRVSIAYGATPGGSGAAAYTAMGTTSSPTYGGSKDAVVVAHTHTYSKSIAGRGYRTASDDNPLSTLSDATTTSTGVSGIDKNLPPYIVTLFIQKL